MGFVLFVPFFFFSSFGWCNYFQGHVIKPSHSSPSFHVGKLLFSFPFAFIFPFFTFISIY